jgi:hypothetical protein
MSRATYRSTLLFAFGSMALGCSSERTQPAAPVDASPMDVNALPDGEAPLADAGADSVGESPLVIPLVGCGVNYTATVTVGGSKPFQLIVDTGSSVLGVAGSACTACTDAGVSPVYSPGVTATDTHETASESFANTEGWSGEIYDDQVALGEAKPVDVKLVDIGSESGFFSSAWCGVASNQGILGLGPTDLLLPGTGSYLDQRKQAGAVDVFSVQLCATTGTLWLGGFDPTYTPEYTPMSPGQKFYTVVLSSIDVGGTSLGLPPSDFGDAFVDTGGDALWLPLAAFTAATEAIGKSAFFQSLFGSASTFFSLENSSCYPLTQSSAELDAMLPALTLTFSSGITVQAPATSSYLNDVKGCGYLPSLFTRGAADDGLPPVELGAPILHGKLVVIDRAQKRIGFAPAPCQ